MDNCKTKTNGPKTKSVFHSHDMLVLNNDRDKMPLRPKFNDGLNGGHLPHPAPRRGPTDVAQTVAVLRISAAQTWICASVAAE